MLKDGVRAVLVLLTGLGIEINYIVGFGAL